MGLESYLSDLLSSISHSYKDSLRNIDLFTSHANKNISHRLKTRFPKRWGLKIDGFDRGNSPLEYSENVVLVCSGRDQILCLEDLACAGLIVEYLQSGIISMGGNT